MQLLKKYFCGLFLFAVLVLSLAANSAAQPPEVNNPLERRLYKGSLEEITAFVTQRQLQLEKIISDIDEGIGKDAVKDVQNSATAVKDLFRGLSLQSKSLLKELSRTTSIILNKPSVTGPPYDIEDFDRIIFFQRETSLHLTDSSKRFALLRSRLTSLKDNSVSRLSEYAMLLKTDPENNLLLYEKYGKLLNLQSEYALLQIKKPKLEELLSDLNDTKKNAADWVKEAFTELKVRPEDIKKAQKLWDKRQTFFKKTTDMTSAEYQDLNRRVLIYEAQLDEVQARLDEGDKEGSPERDGLQIEKERSERIRTWSALHLTDTKEQVLTVLYYPLFSIDTSTVTLLIILKIIFLLFLGITFLRLLRRKVAALLEKKAGMSIGAINSITTLSYYACLLIGTLIVLSSAGFDLSQLSIILGALGVGIGFGLQTITNNFICGIIPLKITI